MAALIILGILSITFFLLHLAPGDPASVYIAPDIPRHTVENIRRQMGLDLPVWQQYFHWIGEFVQGNFGYSFSYKRPVWELLRETIPNTLRLTAIVFVLQLTIGVLVGIPSAILRNTRIDRVISGVLVFFYSIPGFWLALTAILIFSYHLGWLPSSQMATIGLSGDFWTVMPDRLRHLVLPVFVLVLPFAAYTARFVRGSFCEILDQDYVRTAFAYGLSRGRIYFRYALKNALLPLATLLGLSLPFLLGGAVITEYIFSWPGMGQLTIESIFTHDFPVILAATSIAAAAVVFGNLISDILYVIIDPRIKVKGI